MRVAERVTYPGLMSDLNEVGDRDNWICWLCDTAVDPDASVNADRGPSVDSFVSGKTKRGPSVVERLAHRSCNTMKGKKEPVVAWAPELLVVDPSPIVATVDRLIDRATILRFSGKSKRKPLETHGAEIDS